MARGKNEVTVDLAGDATSLDRAFKRAEQASEGLEKAFDGVSNKAKTVDTSFDRIGKSVSTSSTNLDKARKNADDYGNSIDRVGESADNAETRFTGLASGIDGVTTLMADPSPQEFAQGIADVSDGVANSFVPALKRGLTSVKAMSTGMKLLTGGLALGVIGLAAYAVTAGKTEINVEKLGKALQRTDAASKEQIQSAFEVFGAWGKLDEMFGKIIEEQPELADEFMATAEAADLSGPVMEELRQKYEEIGTASDFAALEIRDVANALRAQMDPLFGAADAAQGVESAQIALATAQENLNAAITEYGANSEEAEAAQRELEAAERAGVTAAYSLDQAQRELAAAVTAGDVSVSAARQQLQRWVSQGHITQTQANNMAAAFENAGDAALDAHGNYTINLFGNDYASGVINRINEKLRELPTSKTIRVHVTAGQGGGGGIPLAEGGIVPQYAASGRVIDGPVGTDRVPAWLTPGEIVLNKGQQSNLFKMLDSGRGFGRGAGAERPINIFVAGSIRSDKDLVKVIRDEFARGGFQ